jgi:hypothetical protein
MLLFLSKKKMRFLKHDKNCIYYLMIFCIDVRIDSHVLVLQKKHILLNNVDIFHCNFLCTLQAPCRDPGTPDDGIRYDNTFQHNDRVRFACKSGKTMKGEAVLSCNNGEWDHDPPKCLGKLIKFICSLLHKFNATTVGVRKILYT